MTKHFILAQSRQGAKGKALATDFREICSKKEDKY
jgi:hypothetical protein